MFRTLISAEELRKTATAPRIFDCRARLGDPSWGPSAYAEGHIPGALHVSLDDDLAAPPGAGGRHPLPDPLLLQAKFRSWGVNDEDQLVFYDDAGGAFAARAWWCARWLGHEATAVLDGGMRAWIGPVSLTVPEVTPGNFSTRPALTRAIDAQTLLSRLPEAVLIDARSEPRFRGEEEPIDPVAGHIPGAVCLPFQGNLTADGRFRSPAELARRFQGVPDDAICYCGSGVTAAHNVLCMRVAGLSEPLLYPGSWSEWILDPERPRAP